jgi:hypothetical protein
MKKRRHSVAEQHEQQEQQFENKRKRAKLELEDAISDAKQMSTRVDDAKHELWEASAQLDIAEEEVDSLNEDLKECNQALIWLGRLKSSSVWKKWFDSYSHQELIPLPNVPESFQAVWQCYIHLTSTEAKQVVQFAFQHGCVPTEDLEFTKTEGHDKKPFRDSVTKLIATVPDLYTQETYNGTSVVLNRAGNFDCETLKVQLAALPAGKRKQVKAVCCAQAKKCGPASFAARALCFF